MVVFGFTKKQGQFYGNAIDPPGPKMYKTLRQEEIAFLSQSNNPVIWPVQLFAVAGLFGKLKALVIFFGNLPDQV